MTIPKMNNVSASTKLNTQTRRMVYGKAQPSNRLMSIADLSKLMQNIIAFKRYYNLYDNAFNTLCSMCNYMIKENRAFTIYGLCVAINSDVKNKTSMLELVQRLEAKGLLQVVGYGKYNAKVYAPTTIAIKSLDALVRASVG